MKSAAKKTRCQLVGAFLGWLLIIFLVTLMLLHALGTFDWLANPVQLMRQNTYEGELRTKNEMYRVSIYDSWSGRPSRDLSLSRKVYLNLYNKKRFKVYGYDHDGDGQFDELFHCDASRNSCGSVIRWWGDLWFGLPSEWFIKPFGKGTINFALSELHAAVEHVHNKNHLAKRLERQDECTGEMISEERLRERQKGFGYGCKIKLIQIFP